MHDDPRPGSIPAAAEERSAREAFESVMRLKPLVRRENGEYLSEYTQEDWELWLVAWQARAALAAPKAEAWQPIETAPKDGTWVLLWEKGWPEGHATPIVGRWEDGRWEACTDHVVAEAMPQEPAWIESDVCTKDVTHWMPLPPAPTSPAPQEESHD